MRHVRRALARVAALFGNRDTAAADLRAEMEAHLAMETAEHIRRGLPPDEARRRAAVTAGGLTAAAEQVREERGLPWLETLSADTRYAFRHFRRTPLSTATMILVLSLGIGTNVVLFTMMNELATHPPTGIAEDDALVRIRGTMRAQWSRGDQPRLMSWPEVREYAGRDDLFASVAAHAIEPATVTIGDGSGISASVIFTTANYFTILDTRPVLGALPFAEPNVTHLSRSPTAMITHAMWVQKFGGARDVVGRTVRINGVPVQIAGVAPPRFVGTGGSGASTLWVPLAAWPLIQKRTTAVFASADSTFLAAIAQLKPGVTVGAATPVVARIAERVFRPGQGPSRLGGGDVALVRSESGSADVAPMRANNDRAGDNSDFLFSAAVATGFALLVLLITCTNVSALLVGLAVARRREIGVRLSLGAPRSRLIRQLLTESVLLAAVAAVIGLAATAAGVRILGASLVDVQLVVDWRVTLATCAVAIGAGILFGLSPALHATRVSVGEVLKGASASVAATRSRLQRALVVAQIALTQPLLVGLGVVIVTMASETDRRGTSVNSGEILEIELDAWAGRATSGQASNDDRAARIAAAVERVAALPGVRAAMPMQMGTITMPLAVHASDRVAGVTPEASMPMSLVAAPKGYFESFGIPIVRGRNFTATELTPASNDVFRPTGFGAVILGSDLASRLFGSADPLGRRLVLRAPGGANSLTMTVVGIADADAAGPSDVNGQVRAYVPYSPMNTGVVVRTAGPALPMLGTVRNVVAAEAPQMPVRRAQTMEQREAETRRDLLRTSGAVAAGGLLALLLSAIGLYAVVSFAINQHTREIGIRAALGAQRSQVVRMFFARGIALSALGLVIGLPISIVVTRMIAGMLHWPMASSPTIGLGIGTVTLIVAVIAVWIPARRASTIDPIIAMRAE